MASLSLKARGSKGANQRDIFFYSLSVLTSCVRSIRNFLACASSPSSPSTSPQSTLPAAELDAAATARAHAVLREEDATRSERPVLRQTRSGRGGGRGGRAAMLCVGQASVCRRSSEVFCRCRGEGPFCSSVPWTRYPQSRLSCCQMDPCFPPPPTLLLPLLRPRLFSPPHNPHPRPLPTKEKRFG